MLENNGLLLQLEMIDSMIKIQGLMHDFSLTATNRFKHETFNTTKEHNSVELE